MNISRPNTPLGMGPTVGGGDQTYMQCAEMESAVESIGEGGEVVGRAFSESECMVTPAQAGLEVAQYGVGPLERGQILGLSCADYGRLMHASGCADDGKAGQPVGEHGAARSQTGLGPLPDGLEAEAGDGGEFNAQRMTVIAERDGGEERDLVFRASTDFAAATLTAQVGIIDLGLTFEDIMRLALGHRTHQLVVDQPGRRVAHPQVSHQRERRQPGLGLADKVDREKPDAQGQFAALHQVPAISEA